MLIVFRYGHRIIRDKRLTMHVFLVARAFFADAVIYCGDKDTKIEGRILKLKKIEGRQIFSCFYCQDWKEELLKLKKEGYSIVHLTMYGDRILEKLEELKQKKDKMVVFVGSKKVPSEIYQIADYNISITKEPHSEAAALAVFLNEITEKKALY
ncbi:MAG: tRNA (cytidine(56)-2'-O)-methyltransferase [Candidatus Omnitrophica bacterium]|nr:tRNA (cytidine(56)-2'-O)-methyltransferase [Candidatus Omnitrophota bacterium]